jgi:hypothetical protein
MQLENDLRQAFENFCQDRVSGPWDALIETFASVVNSGTMDLETAARINLLLARTQGALVPDVCGTCHCPVPGLTHHEHA